MAPRSKLNRVGLAGVEGLKARNGDDPIRITGDNHSRIRRRDLHLPQQGMINLSQSFSSDESSTSVADGSDLLACWPGNVLAQSEQFLIKHSTKLYLKHNGPLLDSNLRHLMFSCVHIIASSEYRNL